MAGLKSLACIVIQGDPSPEDLLEDQLVENAIRKDLKPIEQAKAFRRLMDRNRWSARQLGRELNLADATIVRASALLNLTAEVQRRVEAGELAPATAYEVSKMDGGATQAEVAARVVAEGLSRDETVEIVKRAAASSKGRGAKGKAKGPKLPTSRGIRTAVGLKVTVEGRKGFETSTLLAALREAVAKVEAEAGDDQLAA